ncbi:bifunctional adenosylcobinamide kinase/adenosylcobinamide-phosphate guanylyltransferase [Microbispora sp. NPDC049125]|uniref:bifunctional adenosylcobinamide kinase/adenosylcobinamide-phosphate guanylyltransferase n=1 Tax=Microbispora sp. NPDC049125 TaxID=3154929 RepID=UPI003464FD0E
MEVHLEGTGGPGGWPEPGCGCASCGRLPSGHRRPASIVVDGAVRLPRDLGPGITTGPTGGVELGSHGWEITGRGGERVLYAPGPLHRAAQPAPSPAAPFDLVLADLLDEPGRLGDLRHRGLVTPATRVIAVGLDHRMPTEAELARRLDFWGAGAVPDGTVLSLTPGAFSGLHPVRETTRVAVVSGAQRRPAGLPPRTLLLGGSRSGKSEEAEMRVAGEPHVTYVATGPTGGDDPAWLARVRAHRLRRPAHWRTAETTDLVAILGDPPGTLLIDGLGTWLAAVFDECGAWPEAPDSHAAAHEPHHGRSHDTEQEPGGDAEGSRVETEGSDRDARDRVARRCDELVAAWRQAQGPVVAVSDEVGLGVVPASASGRVFRDALGRLNQRLARESEDVALIVAGRVVPLPV